MKRIMYFILFLISSLFSIGQSNSKHVYVSGYYRSNGTYVQGHYRTAPNNTINDNFSTVGNINPYTGKLGWINRESNDLRVESLLFYKPKYPKSFVKILSDKVLYNVDNQNYGVINYANHTQQVNLNPDVYYACLNNNFEIEFKKGLCSQRVVHGKVEFYVEGQQVTSASYHYGKPTGVHKYYSDGKLELEVKFHDSGLPMWTKVYDPTKSDSYTFTFPLENGDTIKTLYVDGVKSIQVPISGRLRFNSDYPYHGFAKTFHPNGELELVQRFEHGFPKGTFKSYKSNGDVVFDYNTQIFSLVDTVLMDYEDIESLPLIYCTPVNHLRAKRSGDKVEIVCNLIGSFFTDVEGYKRPIGHWFWFLVDKRTNEYHVLKDINHAEEYGNQR